MTSVNGQSQQQPKPRRMDTKPGDSLYNNTSRDQNEFQKTNVGGRKRSNSSVMVSQTAFEKLLETPKSLHQGDEAAEESPDREGQDNTANVLVTLLPDKATAKAEATPQPAQGATQYIKVDELAKLMTRQMNAALRTGSVAAQYPVSIAIPLDATTGLKEVQVQINDGVLVVTLTRSVEQAIHDIKQAALNLAQILQSRYPTKMVKISERVDTAADEIETAASDEQKPQLRISDIFPTGRGP